MYYTAQAQVFGPEPVFHRLTREFLFDLALAAAFAGLLTTAVIFAVLFTVLLAIFITVFFAILAILAIFALFVTILFTVFAIRTFFTTDFFAVFTVFAFLSTVFLTVLAVLTFFVTVLFAFLTAFQITVLTANFITALAANCRAGNSGVVCRRLICVVNCIDSYAYDGKYKYCNQKCQCFFCHNSSFPYFTLPKIYCSYPELFTILTIEVSRRLPVISLKNSRLHFSSQILIYYLDITLKDIF